MSTTQQSLALHAIRQAEIDKARELMAAGYSPREIRETLDWDGPLPDPTPAPYETKHKQFLYFAEAIPPRVTKTVALAPAVAVKPAPVVATPVVSRPVDRHAHTKTPPFNPAERSSLVAAANYLQSNGLNPYEIANRLGISVSRLLPMIVPAIRVYRERHTRVHRERKENIRGLETWNQLNELNSFLSSQPQLQATS